MLLLNTYLTIHLSGEGVIARRKGGRGVKDLAIQRALILYSEAVKQLRLGRPDRARRYVEIGLRLLAKAKAKKPMPYRRWVCKNCGLPLVPGLSATVRIRGDRKHVILVRRCIFCGWVSRLPMPRKKSKKVIEAIQGDAHVRIGKQGVTESVLKEIDRLLEDRGVIKVKVLRSLRRREGFDIDRVAEEVAEKLGARVEDVRGGTFVLSRRKRKE